MTPSARLGNRGQKYSEQDPDPPVGVIKDITITNFNGQSERPPECSVTGIPGHPVENLELNNVIIHAPGGGADSLIGLIVPEKIDAYPQVRMFGNNLPAYGIYFRHIKEIKINFLTKGRFQIEIDNQPAEIFEGRSKKFKIPEGEHNVLILLLEKKE